MHYYFEDHGIELYNLKNDIGEKNNLAKQKTKKELKMNQTGGKKPMHYPFCHQPTI